MVIFRQDDQRWKFKLTPVSQVSELPNPIVKIINQFGEWAKGEGYSLSKEGDSIRAELNDFPAISNFVTHFDNWPGTHRNILIKTPSGKEIFVKSTGFKAEVETLAKLKGTGVSGEPYGMLQLKKNTLVIRKFVEGLDSRAIDYAEVPHGAWKKLARSLGTKLRIVHEKTIALAPDTDIIVNLPKGEIYFVDFEHVGVLRDDYRKLDDITTIGYFLYNAREKSRKKLLDIFLKSYGGLFLKSIKRSDFYKNF